MCPKSPKLVLIDGVKPGQPMTGGFACSSQAGTVSRQPADFTGYRGSQARLLPSCLSTKNPVVMTTELRWPSSMRPHHVELSLVDHSQLWPRVEQ